MKRDLRYGLIDITRQIIEKEKLPKQSEIRFRDSLGGVRRRIGVCIKHRIDDSYVIIINTVKTKFFPDPNGKFKSKKTGERLRKAIIGDEVSDDLIVYTLAHEIAHLKFFKHTKEHKLYTEHILEEIKVRIPFINPI